MGGTVNRAGAVCHELRNPLHVLKSSIAMVLDDNERLHDENATLAHALHTRSNSGDHVGTRSAKPDPRRSDAARRELASDVTNAIERMEGTVNDVLDFRKLDSGMFKTAPKPVQLLSLMDDVCRHCRPFLAHHVEMGYRVSPPDAVVLVDSRRVFQIITNGLRYACAEASSRLMHPHAPHFIVYIFLVWLVCLRSGMGRSSGACRGDKPAVRTISSLRVLCCVGLSLGRDSNAGKFTTSGIVCVDVVVMQVQDVQYLAITGTSVGACAVCLAEGGGGKSEALLSPILVFTSRGLFLATGTV